MLDNNQLRGPPNETPGWAKLLANCLLAERAWPCAPSLRLILSTCPYVHFLHTCKHIVYLRRQKVRRSHCCVTPWHWCQSLWRAQRSRPPQIALRWWWVTPPPCRPSSWPPGQKEARLQLEHSGRWGASTRKILTALQWFSLYSGDSTFYLLLYIF